MFAIRYALLSLVGLSSSLAAQTSPPLAPEIRDSSWYAEVSEDVRRGEYVFHPLADEPGVWSAPNRSHDFRSRVSAAGLEVFPRETSADGVGAAWKLRLRTTSFGRLGDFRDLGAASISIEGSRAQLDHGVLEEWLENREDGLEQGYSIAACPKGVGPVWIGLEIGGELSLRINEGGRSGVLVDASRKARLRYRGLEVRDATGRDLIARLRSSPAGVGIEIDDAGAIYPLTVDPVLSGPEWTAQANQTSAHFGWSVATAGDVNGDGYSDVIVGAFLYDNGQSGEGRAFVYLGSSGGLATSYAWSTEGDQVGAQFGVSVATAGDVNGDGYSDVIVGAYLYSNGQNNEGRAFVYLGSSGGLAPTAAWTAESDQVDAQFGESVASAGDVDGDGYSDVIVGAFGFSNGEFIEGRAFMYLGSSGGLATTAAWTAESDQDGALFADSVAPAGDVNSDGFSDVIVGAPLYDNGESGEGRAFVYLGSSEGLSTTVAWTAESNQDGAKFGDSVATAGDGDGDGYSDVIVGAPFYDNGQGSEGRAFVYLGSSGGLATSAAWTAGSNQAGARFGNSVVTAGDVNGDGYSDVIVGAPLYDNGEAGEGRAFVYLGSSGGPATSAAWTAESDQINALFGYSVATAGDVDGDGYSDVIVGAPYYDDGQSDEGAAFAYLGSATGLDASAAWTSESDQATAQAGFSVSSAGDVNGDGFSDVIVGAPFFDNGQSNEGRAFVYLGSASGLSSSADWTAEGEQAGAQFGLSVATAGDVNNDGFSDVIVGALFYDSGQTDEGRAFVYLGSAGGLSLSPAWTAESDQASAFFGKSVAGAGDVNGDGYGDVIVGAQQYDNGQTNEGRVFVYLGSAGGLSAGAAWTAESDQAEASFGARVATAGDVNADGYSDVIVGAVEYDGGETDEGGAFVYLGSSTGLSAGPSWTAEGNQAVARFGNSVATAGDVNGDGYSDVIVGAPLYGAGDKGRAFAYLGSATGLATSADWMGEGDKGDDQFGSSVATAGDVDGDGYSDVIVGAPFYDNGQSEEGQALVYLGSAGGLTTGAAWTAESNQVNAAFGSAVATAGDVNGDGYGDVIVGALNYDNGQTDEGRAFVYLGNEGHGGWTRAVQQRRRNDSAPIDLLGRSNSPMRMRVQLAFEKSLAGFSWASPGTPTARLEWQVANLGVPLEMAALDSGADQTITGLPLLFNEIALLPVPLPPIPSAYRSYHWRARLRTNNPVFPVTPWVSIARNNVTEAKLITPTAIGRR